MRNLLLNNANILTMANEKPYLGSILILDGKIKSVNFKDTDQYMLSGVNDLKTFDAQGNIVMPGLIDAHCHIGMWNDSLGLEGEDGNEETEPVTPHLRAIDGIYHDDRYFTEAMKSGITTVVTGPGSANVLGGQFAALKTYGNYVDEMILKVPVAIKAALGENPKAVYSEKKQMPTTRMSIAALIREALYEATDYMIEKENYINDPVENEKPKYNLKLEALIPVLQRKIPLKIHAHRADDIATAIRIKNEFNLWVTIEHCTEGHLIIDLLKMSNVMVTCGSIISDRSKPELRNLISENAGILSKAGIIVAIITDHPETPIGYLTLSAALAVKAGMDKEEALKAITINAARVCGIEEFVGSIEPGKDGDLIVIDGDLLDINTNVVATIINGEVVYAK